ncbi:hypothetical protein J5N97_009351 [Dioscorea zingiberensis]|uniref:Protein kinase domain-containing protein n=1 Tax=Dioscorea zingiberensis TaxID=325984 RepID=A0A9D5CWP8_9LILI|nr:hypothetical protein J5N97_009351 [Dioscorea zingiberensis]
MANFIATPLLLLLLLLLLLPPFSTAGAGAEEGASLIQFKQSLVNAPRLSSWTSKTPPCDPKTQWLGVLCLNGFVAGLRLELMGLSGQFNPSPLKQLRGLRAISLAGNTLSGPLPDSLTDLTTLRALYLQGNNFSGPIPPNLFSKMTRLRKLYLAGNHFSGEIPASISQSKGLVELHLEGNQFSGSIPDLASLKSLKSFNVSHNELQGRIPESVSKFGASAFVSNPGLCGVPLLDQPCEPQPPAPAPADSQTTTMDTILAAAAAVEASTDSTVTKKDIPGLVMLMTIFVLAFSVIVWGLAFPGLRIKGDRDSFSKLGEKQNSDESLPAESSRAPGSPERRSIDIGVKAVEGSTAELVMVNEGGGPITLSDLMKAAAEVLGNGGLGSAYKAVLGTGLAVAVKRMRDMNRAAREGFEAEMRRLGRMNHPNVLPPLAYHYRKDEKLLVSEYMPKGSLLYVLHGNQGADHAALDWATRMKIILGITRGVAYIHAELATLDIPHGNLKSGNVLLNENFEPLIVDYGFISLVNPSQAALTMFAYKSPEALSNRHVSPKSDVYCLGIIILELITGKFPSQYLNNTKGGTDVVQWASSAVAEGHESDLLDPDIAVETASIRFMQQLVRVSLTFVEPDPDRRPDMKEALDRIEEVVVAATDGNGEVLRTRHEDYVRSTSGRHSVRRMESTGLRSGRRNGNDDHDDDESFAAS